MDSQEKSYYFYIIFGKTMRTVSYILFIIFIASKVVAQDIQLSLPIKHSSYVTRLIFSSDKRYVYTSSSDLSIKLWYFTSGNIVKTFIGHSSLITDIAVSVDNSFLFSADKEGNLFVWNVFTGQILDKIKTGVAIECIHWFDQKKELSISTADGKITWYSFPDLTVKKTISTSPYVAVKILKAKEANFYYFGFKKCNNCTSSILQRGNVQMYDMESNTFFPLCSYTDDLNNLILSPDSTKLVSSSAENYMVRVWDTGKLIEDIVIKNPAKPYALFVSRTNKMIGVGSIENGEIHIYRSSGENIMSMEIDTGYLVYGEINKDITRIHLLNNFGQFKKYNFQFELREHMGNYASIHDVLTAASYSVDNKIVAMGLKNGKTKLLDLYNIQTTFIPDSFNTSVKQVMASKDKVVILYDPYFYFNESEGTFSCKSKFAIYDIKQNVLLKSLVFNEKYITSICLKNDNLILGFNNGIIEFWNINQNKKIDEFQASPYDILKIYYNEISKKIMIQSIDNKLFIFKYKAYGKFELMETIGLDNNNEITAFYSDNYATKTNISFNNSIYKHAVEFSSFLNREQCIIKSKDSLYSINSNDSVLWSKSNHFFNTQYILNDSIINKTILIDNHGNICLLNSFNGSKICDVYFNENSWWVCKSDKFYDVSEPLENKVFAVKGITFVESSIKNSCRVKGLMQKLLIEESK